MKKRALLIIDMQNEFCLIENNQEELCLKPKAKALVKTINQQIELARGSKTPIIWINWGIESNLLGISQNDLSHFNNFNYPETMSWKRKYNGEKKVLERGSWSAQVVKELKMSPVDYIVHKTSMSGIPRTNLHALLQSLEVSELEVMGINKDQCVQATIDDLRALNYSVNLVLDATDNL